VIVLQGDSTVLAQERNAALAEADRMRRELGQYVTQVGACLGFTL
jgi:hypothetical protein